MKAEDAGNRGNGHGSGPRLAHFVVLTVPAPIVAVPEDDRSASQSCVCVISERIAVARRRYACASGSVRVSATGREDLRITFGLLRTRMQEASSAEYTPPIEAPSTIRREPS